MKDGLHVVHVRVNDAATGQPTPCRVRFEGADGQAYAPLGRYTLFPTLPDTDVGLHYRRGARAYSFVDGTFEIALPADPITVEVTKGPEYRPIAKVFTLGPGKMALRFSLERWRNLAALGWHGGDCRCHHLSPHSALLEGAAEGLAVVNLLVRNWDSNLKYTSPLRNIEAFSGDTPCLKSPESMVVVNTFNVNVLLGSLALLNCHRIVFPLSSGVTGFKEYTLNDWCGQCHRKNGLVIWSEPFLWLGDFEHARAWAEPGFTVVGPEGLALLLTGRIDALEVTESVRTVCQFHNWYALLNAGFRVPLVGSSAKVSNEELLGAMRTFAYLGPDQPFSYAAWIEAVRQGKTCVSNGPLIEFKVNGQPPGGAVAVAGNEDRLELSASMVGGDTRWRLEIVGNGEEIADAFYSGDPVSAQISLTIPAGRLRWIAARCRAESPGGLIAHTSPVYLRNPAAEAPADTKLLRTMQQFLERSAHWAATAKDPRLPPSRDALAETLGSAGAEIDRKLLDP